MKFELISRKQLRFKIISKKYPLSLPYKYVTLLDRFFYSTINKKDLIIETTSLKNKVDLFIEITLLETLASLSKYISFEFGFNTVLDIETKIIYIEDYETEDYETIDV